ncbi:MAG: 6-carboxytetrahydropterin synthase [Bryobacteraceae bacterium]|nr:6-carboxytetrahydropterin synthase [Bryobacteraceae bacterium]MDW8376744.1 6-carboxytetrahydropterin synthase [Bryobacterales bacterium]
MIELTRRYRFSASHRLHTPVLTEAENREVYGKCNHPYGHGHDYILEVRLRGKPDPQTGVLLPVAKLDQLVRQAVLDDYDHKFLNEEVATFRTTPPTTENLAADIYRRLRQQWPFGENPSFSGVRIFETRRNVVELQ